VPCYHDVRKLDADTLQRDGITIDAICGGFPCQDISTAGRQAGIKADRSGLYSEVVRLIVELRPRVVFLENVSNLLSGPAEQPGGWFGHVLGDLAEVGYDCEWHSIPASQLGAHHHRDRVWVVAYPHQASGERGRVSSRIHTQFTDPYSRGNNGFDGDAMEQPILADAVFGRRQGQGKPDKSFDPAQGEAWQATEFINGCVAKIWEAEPSMGRVVDGVSGRLDRHRLAALGNAVVPQIPELLGRAYLEAMEMTNG
jgi:DNA (cytosine-5)-methyltransferase 1